jgi:hypothetical protein
MTTEQINKSLDDLLTNPKSKNFLTHLIKSYFPVTKITRVSEKPRGQFICVLTRNKLISFNEVLAEAFSQTYKDDLKIFWENITKNFIDKESPISEILHNKNVGITGKDTETFMSYGAYLGFLDWLENKINSSDKHINWVVRSIIPSGNKNPFAKPIKEKPVIAASTYSIGETESFKKLFDKFNN